MKNPTASRTNRFLGLAWIVVAFVPWILYWVLSGASMPLSGILLALSASALLNAYRVFTKKIMIMDLVTLLYFVADFASTILLGSTFFLRFGGLLVYLVLCGMAFGSLAVRNPFTYQYARQDWPKEYWGHPIFRATNNTITGLWGFIFLADAILYQIGGFMRTSSSPPCCRIFCLALESLSQLHTLNGIRRKLWKVNSVGLGRASGLHRH